MLLRLGRLAEAEPLLADALGIARAVEDEELVALVLREHARTVAGEGRYDEALAQLDGALERFGALGSTADVTAVRVVQGETLLLPAAPTTPSRSWNWPGTP